MQLERCQKEMADVQPQIASMEKCGIRELETKEGTRSLGKQVKLER